MSCYHSTSGIGGASPWVTRESERRRREYESTCYWCRGFFNPCLHTWHMIEGKFRCCNNCYENKKYLENKPLDENNKK